MCGLCALFYSCSSNETALKLLCGDYNFTIDAGRVYSSDRSDVENGETEMLKKRGPDSLNMVHMNTEDYDVAICGALLQLKGEFTPQPLEMEESGLIMWNGELYPNHDPDASLLECEVGHNDTQVVKLAIEEIIKQSRKLESPESGIDVDSLGRSLCNLLYEGKACPWAFAWWDIETKSIWFARDPLGRRSLLFKPSCPDGDDYVCISSVVGCGNPSNWIEVPPLGVYRGAIVPNKQQESESESENDRNKYRYRMDLSLYPWPESAAEDEDDDGELDLELRLHHALDQAVWKRVVDVTPVTTVDANHNHASMTATTTATDSRIGVLFSGGVDSTLLAALLNSHLPPSEPVDLITACFGTTIEECTNSHDWIAAIDGYNELCAAFPDRRYRLIMCPTTKDDVISNKQKILRCCAPKHSVLDFDVAVVIWFASRGEGWIIGENESGNGNEQELNFVYDEKMKIFAESKRVRSSARVLLSGLGADENFGGYSRHKRAFARHGIEAWRKELASDIGRLWERNMGRDDRCAGDHSRDIRYAFLDEEVMKVARCFTPDIGSISESSEEPESSFSLHQRQKQKQKQDEEQEGESEDKVPLRNFLRSLGVSRSAARPKKAMQFGSRISRLKAHGMALPRRGASKVLVPFE